MKRIFSKIINRWEVAFFWIAVILIVVVVVMLITGFGENRPQPIVRNEAPAYKSLLSDDALAFVELPSQPIAKNPFSLQIKVREAKQQKPWQQPKADPENSKPQGEQAGKTQTEDKVKPPEVKTEEPKQVAKVEEPSPPKPEKPEPPPEPQKPPEVRVVEFLGMMTTTSGKRSAYIQMTNPANKNQELRFLSTGSMLDGLKIENFSEDSLTVIDAKGEKQEILFGQKKSITLE